MTQEQALELAEDLVDGFLEESGNYCTNKIELLACIAGGLMALEEQTKHPYVLASPPHTIPRPEECDRGNRDRKGGTKSENMVRCGYHFSLQVHR